MAEEGSILFVSPDQVLEVGLRRGHQLPDTSPDLVRSSIPHGPQLPRAKAGLRARCRQRPRSRSGSWDHLADSLVDQLAQHVAAFGGNGPQQWLFAGEADDPPHQNTVGHWWRKTLRDAGLSGIKLHDLRHFYASGLIAAGCDVVTVQRSLGHSKATTTLNTYAHLWPTAEDRTRNAAESIIAASLGPVSSTARSDAD